MNFYKDWNWQQDNWPNFCYEADLTQNLEQEFLLNCHLSLGVHKHFSDNEKQKLTIELASQEALDTSEIEGELLDRDSVQSSILLNLGLNARPQNKAAKLEQREEGIAKLQVDLYQNFAKPLSKKMLCWWHALLMQGQESVLDRGTYRKDKKGAMVVASGSMTNPKIHFEAPPSHQLDVEMRQFIRWFNDTAPKGKSPLKPLLRASIAHLYFVSIHPFSDGNGRIARALSQKVLSQALGYPNLVVLSHVILQQRKEYYLKLEQSNKNNQIDLWINYFSDTILAAQKYTLEQIEFLLAKTQFYHQHKDNLNARQIKVTGRIFKEGLQGFAGGLSSANYRSIARTSKATAARDLQDLVKKQIFTTSGVGKATRYQLNLKNP